MQKIMSYIHTLIVVIGIAISALFLFQFDSTVKVKPEEMNFNAMVEQAAKAAEASETPEAEGLHHYVEPSSNRL